MSTNEQQHIKIRIISAIASLIVGTILMCAKFYLYRITLSSAILSDALESIINVVASSFALVSVIIASKPPDESHPYGHGKIEYFSAGFEGALIVLASVGIFTAGLPKIINPGKLSNLQSGLLMLFGVSLVNLFLGIGLIRAGKRTSSLSLVADGKHVLTDVYTSGGVLLGLWLAQITGWYRLDGTIACLVGVNILFSGWTLVKQSFTGLMDASDPELLQRIADALLSNRSDVWIDIHQLRAWRSGNFVHVDFHLILPECYTLLESHQEEKRLQEIIMNLLNGRASVLIHIDPCQKEDCPICHQSECQFRSADRANNESWTLASLIRHGTEKRSHRTAAGDAPKEVSP